MQPIIRARTREWGAVLLVCLFFVKQIEGGNAAVAAEAGRNRHETREPTLALQALQQEKELLQARLERQELRLKTLQEALAIARTESALFQERWTEAELRTKALGVDVSVPCRG